MTDHPCIGMTAAQRAAFEQIATNGYGPFHPKVIAALLARGLIVRSEDEILGRDAFGIISIPTYAVPIPFHMQWCEWCSEQPDIPE